MPLQRGEFVINGITLEAEPFEWARSAWEIMTIRITRTTGWARLTKANLDSLVALYNGAHGSVEDGLKGKVVQYLEGTGSVAFTVSDWRGNSGSFVFVPDTGLEVEEVHGAAEDAPLTGGYYVATIRLVKVG